MTDATSDRFREFVERVKALHQADTATLPVCAPDVESTAVHAVEAEAHQVQRLREFIERAVPIAEGEARQQAKQLLPLVHRIRRWRVPHDLLRVARVTDDEDAYTELVAW